MKIAYRSILSVIALCVTSTTASAIAVTPLITPSAPLNSNQELGQSVANAGDVNGDGYPDVIIGAPRFDLIDGRAYLHFGGPGISDVADLTFSPFGVNENFGTSVAGAGDVNGDGYDDVIIGAYSVDSIAADAGRAYLFHGGPTPDLIPDLVIHGYLVDDRLGISVSGAGDVNGDGFADVIVGADQFDSAGGVGKAYVYFGGASMDTTADLTLTGQLADSRFGNAVSGVGDVNGDGYDDVMVGAVAELFNSGRAYLYFGGTSPDATPDLTFDPTNVGDFFGNHVSGAGDINGDGNVDVIICAGFGGPDGEGEVSVYYGGPLADNVADFVVRGELSLDVFGVSAEFLGDVNRDGYDDLIVGAQGNDAGGPANGRAYVYFGGAPADSVPDLVWTGEEDGGLFGTSVAGCGDLTGDGFPDAIVGADRVGPNLHDGRAYVFDISRYHLTSPAGGETWPVGSTQTVTWLGDDPADLWLSSDGGFTFEKLRSGVGGSEENLVPLLVPHVPTRFAVVKLSPSDEALFGEELSDSLFTIESSVSLLTFAVVKRQGGGAELSWATEPSVGPQGIAGYRLYRNRTRIGPALITETRYVDVEGTQGSTYRLTSVNGLGEELELGRQVFALEAPLTAWPVPYSTGVLNVSFAAGNSFGGGAGQVEVSLYDAAGRRIRTLADGKFEPGYHTTTWDGRDRQGRRVPAGIYFLNLDVEGQTRQMKVVVLQ